MPTETRMGLRFRPERDNGTAAIDEHSTVVGCMVSRLPNWGNAALELAVGANAEPGPQACPVQPSSLARSEEGTVEEYGLRGTGAVRDDSGTVRTDATAVRLRLVGDTATTSHPVVDGVVIA
ncbi:MAG: hypothetical protein IPJ61_05470 [Tessaracoccus sp.]|uniref:hypothetical protein n=1 Tax=Tessaracoccus sp. TaxID=1971211 RepID=UPI001EC3731E|nr:hypothetical protein [Tessaracoccus sp.]MBK7820522.1 hypothetical protein [Tessaracoccus sp.]